MKYYGNLINRLNEGRSIDEISVGTDITMYHYTDRTCYYVTKVNSQKDIEVAEYRVIAKDHSMQNNWEYIKEEKPYIEHWVFRYNKWMQKVEKTIDTYYRAKEMLRGDLVPDVAEETLHNYVLWRMGIDADGYQKLLDGKTIVKYYNLSGNVSFGVRDYHYDYEF